MEFLVPDKPCGAGIWPNGSDASDPAPDAAVWLLALPPYSSFCRCRCHHLGSLDCAPGSGLQPSPVLAATGIRRWELCLAPTLVQEAAQSANGTKPCLGLIYQVLRQVPRALQNHALLDEGQACSSAGETCLELLIREDTAQAGPDALLTVYTPPSSALHTGIPQVASAGQARGPRDLVIHLPRVTQN